MPDLDGHSRSDLRSGWRSVLVVGLVLPLVAAWVMVWSTADRQDALDRVPVAIVNDDTIITGEQPMAAGRALAAALTDPDSGTTRLDWTLTDAKDASDGLRDGTYYAVLTIPSDFSQAILSTATDAPSSGQLTLRSNAAASETVPWISDQVVATAADALGTQATQGYLAQVYGGFNQLAKATKQTAQGADQLARGTSELADGASELDTGALQLAGGLSELAGGAAELEGGTAGVATGAATLGRSSRELAEGVGLLADGADRLGRDSARLARRATQYAGRASQVDRAAGLVAGGSERLSRTAGRLSGELGDLARQCAASGAGPEFCVLLREARARARVVDGGNRLLARGTSGVARATDGLAAAARALARADGALASGADEVARAGRRLDRGAGEVAAGARRLAGAAAEVDGAASRLARGAASSAGAADSLAQGSDNLSSSAAQADDGAQQLSQGLDTQAGQSPTYSQAQQDALIPVVSEPVLLSHSRQHADHDNGWLLGAVVGVILWLAALAGAARADTTAGRRFALSTASSRRIAVDQLVPVLGLALLQGGAVLGALALARVDVASAVPLALLSLLAAASFTAIGFALRLALGAAGVALFGLFLLLQVAALANVLPLETAPAPLQRLNGLLPLTAYVDGASQLVTGGDVHPFTTAVAVVAIWGLAALLATLAVVRRHRLLPTPRPVAAGA